MTTSYTRDRGYTRARRLGLGRDEEEEGREELHSMLGDPDVSASELLAALVSHVSEEQAEDLHHSLRQMTSDARGPRAWARDKLERRRYTRDNMRQRGGRRMGRDLSEQELTRSTSPSIEEFGSERTRDWEDRGAGGEDRRHHGMDSMAYDRMSRSGSALDQLLAGARRIQRL